MCSILAESSMDSIYAKPTQSPAQNVVDAKSKFHPVGSTPPPRPPLPEKLKNSTPPAVYAKPKKMADGTYRHVSPKKQSSQLLCADQPPERPPSPNPLSVLATVVEGTCPPRPPPPKEYLSQHSLKPSQSASSILPAEENSSTCQTESRDSQCGVLPSQLSSMHITLFERAALVAKVSSGFSILSDDSALSSPSRTSDPIEVVEMPSHSNMAARSSKSLPRLLGSEQLPAVSHETSSASANSGSLATPEEPEKSPSISRTMKTSRSDSSADKSPLRMKKSGAMFQSIRSAFAGKKDVTDAEQKSESLGATSHPTTIGQSTPSDISSVGDLERQASDSSVTLGDVTRKSQSSLKGTSVQDKTSKFYTPAMSDRPISFISEGSSEASSPVSEEPVPVVTSLAETGKLAFSFARRSMIERKRKLTSTRFRPKIGKSFGAERDSATSSRRGVELPRPPSMTDVFEDSHATVAFQDEESMYLQVERCQRRMMESVAADINTCGQDLSTGNLSESDAEDSEFDMLADSKSALSDSSLTSVQQLANSNVTMQIEMRSLWQDLPAVSVSHTTLCSS